MEQRMGITHDVQYVNNVAAKTLVLEGERS